MGPKPPFWNLLAVGLPIAGALIGILIASSRGGAGDFAGRLGGAVIGLLVVAVVTSLMRNERMAWLSMLALLGNAVIALPIAALLIRDN